MGHSTCIYVCVCVWCVCVCPYAFVMALGYKLSLFRHYFQGLEIGAVHCEFERQVLHQRLHHRQLALLQYIAACCGVLQCVAVCCSVLHQHLQLDSSYTCYLPYSVLQCIEMCCGVLRHQQLALLICVCDATLKFVIIYVT